MPLLLCAELYEYCLRENIADKNLIAKWKKPGYENVCCLRCIQKQDTNFGTNCVCRVPKVKLEEVCYTVPFSTTSRMVDLYLYCMYCIYLYLLGKQQQ